MKGNRSHLARSLSWITERNPVLHDVLGQRDPQEFADSISDAFRKINLSSPESCLFRAYSVGVVLGLKLESGEKVGAKVHPVSRRRDFLEAVTEAQSHLAATGFPAPRPIAPVITFGDRLMTIEEWRDEGELRDPHIPAVRATMADYLYRTADALSSFSEDPRLENPLQWHEPERLWPVPHNVLFDFERFAQAGDWIDSIARVAKPVATLKGGPLAGHMDWSAKHFRFTGDNVSAIYDWDSLAAESETTIVGNAAATFTYQEELDIERAPSTADILGFVADYEKARGSPFDEEETRAVCAQAIYLLAYGARCEVSYVGTRSAPVTHWQDALRRSWRELLAIDA